MHGSDKLSIAKVKLKTLAPLPSGELADHVFRKCCFCEKNCEVAPVQALVTSKLSGPGVFYCPFCLRHGFNAKSSRDVLILSFRGVIGYFYYQGYVQGTDRNKMWLSEVEDYIAAHVEAGLLNPLFLYDYDTMLWFVNFARIGSSKKKAPVSEVHATVANILACFNLSVTAPNLSMSGLFAKYQEAIDSFYRKRFRPENRRMLIPTLSGCGVIETKGFNLDKTRYFTADEIRLKKS